MKKLLMLFFLCLSVVFASQAQNRNQTISGTTVLKSTPSHVDTDTITNTTVETQSGDVGFNKNVVAVQSTITKLSGTLGGVMRLEGSLNGTNYQRINTTDSLVLANVTTQSKIFTVSPNLWKYIRVKVTPTGSQSSIMNSIALWRRE